MKNLIFTLSLLILGSSAFACPQFDGYYKCVRTNSNGEKTLVKHLVGTKTDEGFVYDYGTDNLLADFSEHYDSLILIKHDKYDDEYGFQCDNNRYFIEYPSALNGLYKTMSVSLEGDQVIVKDQITRTEKTAYEKDLGRVTAKSVCTPLEEQ